MLVNRRVARELNKNPESWATRPRGSMSVYKG